MKKLLMAAVVAACFLNSPSAHAQPEHIIRAEVGMGLVFPPQADRFQNPGFALGAGYEYRFLDWFGLSARYNLLGWSAEFEDGFGLVHDIALDARFYPMPDLERGRLWVGVGPTLALTGGEARFALEAGIGFEFQPTDHLLVGPMMRLTWIIEPAGGELQDDDAVFLQIGATIAYTTGSSAPSDADEDGITDDVDGCVDQPEDHDGFQDEDGCPEPDNDQDGVEDADDACPNEVESANGFEDEDGCPDDAPPPSDRDEDGVADSEDGCPDEPEDMDGFSDADGCPDLDNDEDGIADADDGCPNEAELVNEFEDDDGCPDQPPAAPTATLGQRIYFAIGSSQLNRAGRQTLSEVVAELREYPQARVRVEGYADRLGDEADNQRLSEQRAQAIQRQLVRRGIAAERIETVAYGESRSEGDDESESHLNRRVEFHVAD